MKKILFLMVALVAGVLTFTSCGSDDGDSVSINRDDVVGTWVTTIDGYSSSFTFESNGSYTVYIGTINRYIGKWTLSGNTVHGVTLDPIDEYFTFEKFDGTTAKIAYRNSLGATYNVSATKKK